MPHDSVLILKVCGLLEQEYAPHNYDYITEKAIPGTRMHPDIAIVERSSRRIKCAVEIGYTRPEKLTAYRHELNIPDVRWYDKDGNLHTDIIEKLFKARLTVRQCMADYIDYFEARGKDTNDLERRTVAYILPTLGDLKIEALTTERLRGWLVEIASTPALRRPLPEPNSEEAIRRRRNSANRVANSLRAALNHAYAVGKTNNAAAWGRRWKLLATRN